MKHVTRRVLVLALSLVLALAMMPASAFGALTVTWERNWGQYDTEPYDDGAFNAPGDVAADKWGNVYVTGGYFGDNRVQMFSPNGAFIKKIDNPGSDPEELSQPRSVTTDRWGVIYVSQQGNPRIEVYMPLLYNHSRTIETPADPAHDVTGIAVGLNGTIFNVRSWLDVQVRNRTGEIIAPAITPPNPTGVGVSQDGEIYVSCDYLSNMDDPDDPGHVIGVYNPDLTLKWVWGGYGTTSGLFDRPFDVDIDPAGNVFVVEYGGDRAQVLSSNSVPLAIFGETGSSEQVFSGPMGIGVGLDRTVYVADTYRHRISKWKVSTPTTVAPIEGSNRYLTAVAASKKAYPTAGSARAVVLATGTNWPDALGGSALAGVAKGPLLLTPTASLPAEVAAEIKRLQPQRIYVLGSEAAVSAAVFNSAKALIATHDVKRLGGIDRYETANKIATEVVTLGGDGTAFVCTGTNFPDALAAAPIAAANGWPIYLTRPDYLPTSVRSAMLANSSIRGYIIGSEAAVSATVASQLEAMSPLPVTAFGRYGGDNRYETAAELANAAFDGMGMLWSRPALTTGENFPDALAGGVLQGSDYTLLLLTRKDSLSAPAAAALKANKDRIYEIRFFGDTNAVSTATRTAAKALLW